MKVKKIKEAVKKFWNWVCDLDFVFKWVIILALICIIVIFIFFLILPLIFGSSLSLAGVESSSMSHQMEIVGNDSELRLCRSVYSGQEKKQGQVDFDGYWEACGEWYEQRNISKQTFSEFPLKNGFKKGDIIIVWETSELKIGDIIVFKKNLESTSKLIIHRIVSMEDNIIQTKGDSNTGQSFGMNETNIDQEQIIGKSVFRIPFLSWPKIWVKELIDAFKKSNL